MHKGFLFIKFQEWRCPNFTFKPSANFKFLGKNQSSKNIYMYSCKLNTSDTNSKMKLLWLLKINLKVILPYLHSCPVQWEDITTPGQSWTFFQQLQPGKHEDALGPQKFLVPCQGSSVSHQTELQNRTQKVGLTPRPPNLAYKPNPSP